MNKMFFFLKNLFVFYAPNNVPNSNNVKKIQQNPGSQEDRLGKKKSIPHMTVDIIILQLIFSQLYKNIKGAIFKKVI